MLDLDISANVQLNTQLSGWAQYALIYQPQTGPYTVFNHTLNLQSGIPAAPHLSASSRAMFQLTPTLVASVDRLGGPFVDLQLWAEAAVHSAFGNSTPHTNAPGTLCQASDSIVVTVNSGLIVTAGGLIVIPFLGINSMVSAVVYNMREPEYSSCLTPGGGYISAAPVWTAGVTWSGFQRAASSAHANCSSRSLLDPFGAATLQLQEAPEVNYVSHRAHRILFFSGEQCHVCAERELPGNQLSSSELLLWLLHRQQLRVRAASDDGGALPRHELLWRSCLLARQAQRGLGGLGVAGSFSDTVSFLTLNLLSFDGCLELILTKAE
jgi:hypothetical protein